MARAQDEGMMKRTYRRRDFSFAFYGHWFNVEAMCVVVAIGKVSRVGKPAWLLPAARVLAVAGLVRA